MLNLKETTVMIRAPWNKMIVEAPHYRNYVPSWNNCLPSERRVEQKIQNKLPQISLTLYPIQIAVQNRIFTARYKQRHNKGTTDNSYCIYKPYDTPVCFLSDVVTKEIIQITSYLRIK